MVPMAFALTLSRIVSIAWHMSSTNYSQNDWYFFGKIFHHPCIRYKAFKIKIVKKEISWLFRHLKSSLLFQVIQYNFDSLVM